MKRLTQISFLLGIAPMLFGQFNLGQPAVGQPILGQPGVGPINKGSVDLPSQVSTVWVDVIIQLNNTAGSAAFQNQLTLIQNMVQQQSGQMGLQQAGQNGLQQAQHGPPAFHHINALHLKVPALLIPWLKANPAVRYISVNRPTTKFLDITTSSVAASAAWQSGFDGSGVGVAVIDSGVALKHDLTGANGVTSRVVDSENFATGMTDATDQYGHGTHVAGIIGSAGKDSTGPSFTHTYKGVAPNVNIVSLRVLDANGAGYEADVIAAIERAIDLKNVYNIRVINLSLGRPVFESYTLDPLCQAVEAAWQAGIVVVTAAGNYGRDNSLGTNGYGTIASPGNDPYVITVGAMNAHATAYTSDDTIASYSSKGPTLGDHIVKPDLVAPGNLVVSLLAPNSTLAAQNPTTRIPISMYQTGASGTSTNYFRLSGTSMATPVVSGAVALLIQQHPSLTPDQVKARLMKTAAKSLNLFTVATDAFTFKQYSNQSDIFTVGAGYLNISAALANNDLVTLPALSPAIVRNPVTKKVGILRNFSVIWGTSVLWGDSFVYGNNVFAHLSINATDDSVLWGDSTAIWGQDDSVLWGDSVNGTSSLSALSEGDDDQ